MASEDFDQLLNQLEDYIQAEEKKLDALEKERAESIIKKFNDSNRSDRADGDA